MKFIYNSKRKVKFIYNSKYNVILQRGESAVQFNIQYPLLLKQWIWNSCNLLNYLRYKRQSNYLATIGGDNLIQWRFQNSWDPVSTRKEIHKSEIS